MATLEVAVAEGSQRHVGRTGAANSRVIEAGAIRHFVEALGDPNPLYTDAEYARQTRWGGIIAPPTFLCTIPAPLPVPDLGFGRNILKDETGHGTTLGKAIVELEA